MKLTIKWLFVLVILTISCSNSNFSGNDSSDTQSHNANQNGRSGDGTTGDQSNNQNQYPQEGNPKDLLNVQGGVNVVRVSFGNQQTLMFLGSLGANLKTMTVGHYVNDSNNANKTILRNSNGLFVVSGLKTGAFNEWGFFVKSASPAVTTTQFNTRKSTCLDDEIVIGLPDTGIDVQPGQKDESTVANWNNRYVCAKLSPQYTLYDKVSIPYTHSYNISVDCPDTTVMVGYNCGNCSPPEPAKLTCAKLKSVP